MWRAPHAFIGIALCALSCVPGSHTFSVPARIPSAVGVKLRLACTRPALPPGRAADASRRCKYVRCYSSAGGSDSSSHDESVDSATLSFADGLREHLTGIWGPSGGEDFSVYSRDVAFKDPLASYTGIETYKQALQLLKASKISSGVQFQTHDVSVGKQDGSGLVFLYACVCVWPWQTGWPRQAGGESRC